jgi:hypothetical protein
MDSWIGTISILETQTIEFLFVIIGFIINKFLKYIFDVSFGSGILYSSNCHGGLFRFFLSLVKELLLCFVFDKVYCLINLFIVDNFV